MYVAAGFLQIQRNKFPVDFRDTFFFSQYSSSYYTVSACCLLLYDSDPIYPVNVGSIREKLINWVSQVPNNWTTQLNFMLDVVFCQSSIYKNSLENRLNYRRSPVFLESISISSRFPAFPEVVDTLCVCLSVYSWFCMSVCLSVSVYVCLCSWLCVWL